jgi:hypothetical protein
VHKNIEFSPSINTMITEFRHPLTKSMFRLAETCDCPFFCHPVHSTDREGLMHVVYSETP